MSETGMDLPKGVHIYGIDEAADIEELLRKDEAKYNIRVFIDTEFTDFVDPEMISLGMVADDPSSEELYMEFWFPPHEASDFVKAVVLPLLWHTPDVNMAGKPVYEVREKIIAWLNKIRGGKGVSICFDYGTDWDLFARAMDNDIPEFIRFKRIGVNDFKREDAHEYLAENGLPAHHALYDARSNKFAFNLQKKNRKK